MSQNNQVEIKKETEHIVAILDLLGASEMILSDQSEAVLNAISDIFSKVAAEWVHVQSAPEVLHNIKRVTFSDNIALAIDLTKVPNRQEAIDSFVKYISIFQSAALKNNFLFRGGIAIGKLYMNSESNFVWGKALVDAHKLEEKIAIYPRVILSSNINVSKPLHISRVRTDADGNLFADYIPVLIKLYPNWIEQTKAYIELQFLKRSCLPEQERVLKKYEWLQKYIELCEKEYADIQEDTNNEIATETTSVI